MWFEKLVGFEEISPTQVRENITIDGEFIISKVNGNKYRCGKLELSSLENLRKIAPPGDNSFGQLTVTEVVGDISVLHKDMSNKGAVFQAASQFNLLEMVGPQISPEKGVGIYEYDKTQGPACAIACGAGTIYRNYFVDLHGQKGQTENSQIDCLEELGFYFGNINDNLWEMRNGYALVTRTGLSIIDQKIKSLSAGQYDLVKGKLKVGIQKNTQVTISYDGLLVTQVYCSALPIAYSSIDYIKWESFARLILEATYEATFHVALQNFHQTGNKILYLTLVGGNAFGNPSAWIFDAIRKSLDKFSTVPLDVRMVSYKKSNPDTAEFIRSFYNK